MEKKEWRKDQKKLTREILEKVDIVAFSFDLSGNNKGCNMDNLDGSYGYIKLNDALKNTYPIYDYETDKLLGTYNSIDEVISNGWKVSS